MHKAFNFTYLVNMVVQGFWCLLFSIGVAFGIGWLLVNKLSWPSLVYVPLLVVATIVGLVSMCRFLISSAEAMERMEKQRAEKLEEQREKARKKAILNIENAKNDENIAPSTSENTRGDENIGE